MKTKRTRFWGAVSENRLKLGGVSVSDRLDPGRAGRRSRERIGRRQRDTKRPARRARGEPGGGHPAGDRGDDPAQRDLAGERLLGVRAHDLPKTRCTAAGECRIEPAVEHDARRDRLAPGGPAQIRDGGVVVNAHSVACAERRRDAIGERPAPVADDADVDLSLPAERRADDDDDDDRQDEHEEQRRPVAQDAAQDDGGEGVCGADAGHARIPR